MLDVLNAENELFTARTNAMTATSDRDNVISAADTAASVSVSVKLSDAKAGDVVKLYMSLPKTAETLPV